MPSAHTQIGNSELLSANPIAFFCSTRCDGDAVLKAYEWARQHCELGTTIISSFHTPVEKDVYAILARRGAKIIHCYAKRLPIKRPSPEQHTLIEAGRLLLIAPAACAHLPRPTKQSCSQRNRYVAEIAKEIFVGYLSSDSALYFDLKGYSYFALTG